MFSSIYPLSILYRTVRISTPNSVRFLLAGLDVKRSLQEESGYSDELLARILDIAARINRVEYQLR